MAKKSNALEFINQLPDGLDTQIGERNRLHLLQKILLSLTVIREFLGPSPSAEKKSRIIAVDVTVWTEHMKIICAERVSVELYYDAYFKWHMPI